MNDLKQGCWQKFRFFLKHSYRDIFRHPCHFFLAFSTTYIVVLSSLVVQTVIDKGPIIFVNLVQTWNGEMDVWYSSDITYPNDQGWKMNEENWSLSYLNYTRVEELYGDEFNLAPRFHYIFDEDYFPHRYFFLDLAREYEIGVGISYNWPTELNPDECIVE